MGKRPAGERNCLCKGPEASDLAHFRKPGRARGVSQGLDLPRQALKRKQKVTGEFDTKICFHSTGVGSAEAEGASKALRGPVCGKGAEQRRESKVLFHVSFILTLNLHKAHKS